MGIADRIFRILPQVKPLGGFRTIALLAMPYRIWAKARMQIVREWAMAIPRAYFATGAGKSTEDAVGRLLISVEAQDDDWQFWEIILWHRMMA